MDEFMTTKRRIYEIVESARGKSDKTSWAYDIMILICIFVGLVPLTIKGDNTYTRIIDIVSVIVFFVDYVLRIYTSDYKMGIKSYKAYLANAVMPISIIDLLSITPILHLVFPMSRSIALFRLFRVLLLLKLMRYSTSVSLIFQVLKMVWIQLSAVFGLALIYIASCALVLFQVEPDTFKTFSEALYWAGCTVLAVGYGDITPLTEVGRTFTVISALVGLAVIAIPSGIITAAYMEELKKTHLGRKRR